MAKSIQEITNTIIAFCEVRGWKNEDPNQLITSIIIELAELAEHYQWKNRFSKLDEEEKTEIGFEFADVVFYLFRLAHNSDINIEEYFDRKMPLLEKKYALDADYNETHKHYRETGKSKRYED